MTLRSSGEALGAFYQRESRDSRQVNEGLATDLFRKAAASAEKVLLGERGKRKRQGGQRVEDRRDVEDIELLHFDPSKQAPRDVLTRTSQVLAVFFGVTLVLVGPED
jgi:hypothetical protein